MKLLLGGAKKVCGDFFIFIFLYSFLKKNLFIFLIDQYPIAWLTLQVLFIYLFLFFFKESFTSHSYSPMSNFDWIFTTIVPMRIERLINAL